MSFVGKSLFSLSWLGKLFNSSIESHDEGLQNQPKELTNNHIFKTLDEQREDFKVNIGPGTDSIDSPPTKQIDEFLEEKSFAQVKPIETRTDETEISDTLSSNSKESNSSQSRSSSQQFWQRRQHRDDAAGDCQLPESPLSLSASFDSEHCHEPNRFRCNEESSIGESFSQSFDSSIGFSTSFDEDGYSSDHRSSNSNQLIRIMSCGDFGWSLSDVADDPRRTGLANFRHSILVKPVPTTSVETLSSVWVKDGDGPTVIEQGVPCPSDGQPGIPSQHCRNKEIKSDYETRCGSASSSFSDEQYRRHHNRLEDQLTSSSRHRHKQSHYKLRHLHHHEPCELLPYSDTEEAQMKTMLSSRNSCAAKPYIRQTTVSQCSDSCLGSDFPSLTSTGSSESEPIAVWPEQPAVQSTDRMKRSVYLKNYGQQQEPKTIVSTPLSTANVPTTTPFEASSQTSLTESSSMDCWRGSIHHALAVMEHRGQEMSSLFDQLNEIGSDLVTMNDQVGQVTNTLQQCQIRRRPSSGHRQRRPFLPSQSFGSSYSFSSPKPDRRPSSASSIGSSTQRRHVGSCLDLRSLTEDEMAVIVHRLLTRVCEHTLARQEGRLDVPLIV